MAVTSYSRTAASNNSAPPNGAPEGMTPGSVNNTIRQIMKDIVDEAAKNQCKVLSSVAGTNTITGSLSPALDAYTAGMLVVLTPAATNTGAVTLNINTLGALDVFRASGIACVAGDLVIGVPALLVLDAGADDFILLNPATVSSGTYTPTLTNSLNITSSTAAVNQWMRVGNVVTVSGTLLASCTSGTGTETQLRVSLPIASALAGINQLGGSGAHNISPVQIYADATPDVAQLTWFSSSTGSFVLSFNFSYLIV